MRFLSFETNHLIHKTIIVRIFIQFGQSKTTYSLEFDRFGMFPMQNVDFSQYFNSIFKTTSSLLNWTSTSVEVFLVKHTVYYGMLMLFECDHGWLEALKANTAPHNLSTK